MGIKTLSKNAHLLPFLRYIRYLFHRYLIKLYFRSYKIVSGSKIETIDNDDSTFFGYYNLSPVNDNGEIIYLKLKKVQYGIKARKPASIMFKDVKGNNNEIAQTKAFNLQQGCMLQWIPGTNNLIIYNDYDAVKDGYISKVIDKEGRAIRQYSIAVNSIGKCGKYALSLNFDRLRTMRPAYGYFNRKVTKLPADNNDGIWYLDLKNGKTKLIITLNQLKTFSYSSTMKDAAHKINHIDINPSGKRFMFLHIWKSSSGRFMRLITANSDGTGICVLNGDEMISHCCWLDDQNILSYCYVKERGEGYFKFKDRTKAVGCFSNKLPHADGHPSISGDGKWLITDTYPEKSRMSNMYLLDIKKDQIVKLGYFHQPLQYTKEVRIDLHPKWSKDNRHVFFESGHSGKRNLYCLALNDVC